MFKLPWSHYVRLLSVKNPSAREFYETEALRGGWSEPQLDRQISSLFYERTALSKNKSSMLKKGTKPLEGLPNKVMATEYQMLLPDEKSLVSEIEKTRDMFERRKGNLKNKKIKKLK